LGHRTLSHSLLGVAIIYKIMQLLMPVIFNPNYIYPNVVFWALMIGYISHLVADSTTREGIPLFFPLKINIGIPPLKFLRIRTGSWVENLVVLPATGLYVFWFIGRYQDQLLMIVKNLSK
jgi:inner membrane protein